MVDEAKLPEVNQDQVKYWNSTAGHKWVQHKDLLDMLMTGVTSRLLEKTALMSGEKVLDIGCGTGAVTTCCASEVGPGGSVLALDISQVLLDCAEIQKISPHDDHIEYLLADAQSYNFDLHNFDVMISRFGVMFFTDPVAAFKNISTALRTGGRLSFVSWAPITGNPWFKIPRDAAITRMGTPPPSSPTAPGPLAFSDENRVLGILKDAGLKSCSVETEQVELFFDGTAAGAAALACSLGPAVRIVQEFNGTDSDIETITSQVAENFKEYASSDGVRVPGTLHFFKAEKE